MLIPALDIIDGQVVRLKQGDFARQTTYHSDPVEVACEYAQAGAEYLHIVDLDGARDPAKRQLTLINRMQQESGLPTQTGGGIRTTEDIRSLLATSVERVVVGSTAVKDPALAAQWLNEFGSEAIVLALDINIDADGQRWLATHGWQEQSDVRIETLLGDLIPAGCKHVLCTDISRDGMLSGPNVHLYRDLKIDFPEVVWQASGGVSSLHDLKDLRAVNCDSVILGKALLTGQFTLAEASECWQNA